MPERYRGVVDVYVLPRRGEGQMPLMERANTGYAAANCARPADTLRRALPHPGRAGRIGFFCTATRWRGEPVNREPHKCPGNTVPYTASALAQITTGAPFSVGGRW